MPIKKNPCWQRCRKRYQPFESILMRLRHSISAICLVMAICCPHWMAAQTATDKNAANVPAPVLKAIERINGIDLDCRLPTCVLKGDFDGQGEMDYAVLVAQKKSKARGILLIFASGQTELLGAGNPVQYGAAPYKDLNFDEWEVYSKDKVIESGENQPILKLNRDSLLVSYNESASGLFYWLHGRAHWYQQGD